MKSKKTTTNEEARFTQDDLLKAFADGADDARAEAYQAGYAAGYAFAVALYTKKEPNE